MTEMEGVNDRIRRIARTDTNEVGVHHPERGTAP
jgi:hypothetical protein